MLARVVQMLVTGSYFFHSSKRTRLILSTDGVNLTVAGSSRADQSTAVGMLATTFQESAFVVA